MRYSDLVATAFVAGAMAGPHHRRRKAPCSSLTAEAAATSDIYAVPNPASTQPAGSGSSSLVVVPVPVPAPSSSGPVGHPSLAPSGGNGTAPRTTTAAGAASSAAGAVSSAFEVPQTSDVPEVSSALDISSAVDASVTSSALPAESSALAGDSNVPVGQAIFSCTEPGTFALTYDDGPFLYTDHILDLLAATDIKVRLPLISNPLSILTSSCQATFFVNGNNFGNINDYQAVVRRMIADGHQVGSHTYAHPDLATLGDAAVITAMTDLEEALDAIIGVTPTYMRPPYFSYNDQTLAVLGELGYHVIHADIDTLDYMFRDIGNLTGAANLEAGIAAGGNLALAHDASLSPYF
jgi:peptidoglycan/xylan/chitin deacetylase (PgdA/CDA1 family)